MTARARAILTIWFWLIAAMFGILASIRVANDGAWVWPFVTCASAAVTALSVRRLR